MKTVLFYILSILFFRGAAAQVSNIQEQFVEKPSKFLTEFPFKLLNGSVILLEAKFNNLSQTLNFILDTGSGGISLDSATCHDYNIPHSPSGRTINGIAGIREVDFAKNNTLTLPGLKVEGLDFYVNNYEILTSVYGEKIDGIIGYSFFSKYIIKINFDSSKIQVYNQGSMKYPAGGHLLHPLFTTLPIQSLKIKDDRSVSSNFYLDTGAGLSFLLSKDFIDDSFFLMKKRNPLIIQAQGFGGKKRMSITITKELKLGPYKFKRVPTYILDDEYNATSYPYTCGLVGNDLLRRFNLIFNYKKREVHLLPNSHFRDDFDYSYTGMSIYYIDGKILVDDIVPGSPADRAKFQKDDVIISVNNNFSNNINEYKNLLQSSNQIIKVLILRNNSPLIISFKVGRIS